jgi:hypothetical protein
MDKKTRNCVQTPPKILQIAVTGTKKESIDVSVPYVQHPVNAEQKHN